MANWVRCAQCGRRYWAGDFYKPMPSPPRLPSESGIRYVWRKMVLLVRHEVFLRRVPASLWSRDLPVSLSVCEGCSAQNEEGWKARARSDKQAARLETVEKMLAGLKQPLRDEEQVEPGWDARRAELIKDLEAERAKLLEEP